MPAPLSAAPDPHGRFGVYGGTYVPETLMFALEQLRVEYEKARRDAAFQRQLEGYLRDYVGRPSPLYLAQRLTESAGGPRLIPLMWAALHVVKTVSSLIGGTTGNVVGAGLKPGAIGIYQVQLELGAGTQPNQAAQVTISQDIYTSNIVTIPVADPNTALP